MEYLTNYLTDNLCVTALFKIVWECSISLSFERVTLLSFYMTLICIYSLGLLSVLIVLLTEIQLTIFRSTMFLVFCITVHYHVGKTFVRYLNLAISHTDQHFLKWWFSGSIKPFLVLKVRYYLCFVCIILKLNFLNCSPFYCEEIGCMP